MRDSLISAACVLSLQCLCCTASAVSLSTTNNQGSSSTTGWNAAIWKTNSAGTVNLGGTTLVGPAVGPPVAGNNYSAVSNGIVFSANSANTIIRNPFASGTTSPQTFPGDSLTLFTNTEIRFKQVGSGNVPTCNFPGVGGNPGLILNGGLLNGGDDTTYPVTGWIRVDSQSYFALGNNGGQAPTAAGRRFNVSAKITGSGNLVFFNGSNFVAQVFSGSNDTYTGTWILKSAWLQATNGALGTNSGIVADPLYVLPLDPGILDTPGPADFEPQYDVNSAGTLALTNGGRMRLHQNCAFTQVVIQNNTDNGGQGTNLSLGTHYYAELRVNFPTTFPAGGSGSLTVQPYGSLAVGPQVATQPLPQQLYAGRTAHFAATGSGPSPLSYFWQKNGGPLSDGGNVTGSTTTNLTISGVSAGDVAGYSLIVSNPVGSVTSSVAPLSLVAPSGEAYEAAVLADSPVAFYQLNELGDPATNNSIAYDFQGGYNALYGTGAQNGNPNYNIAGPRTEDAYPGFAAGNLAAQFTTLNSTSHVSVVAPWNLNTNAVTITAWIKPSGTPGVSAGIVFCRGGATTAGLGFSPSLDLNGNTTLSYAWNNESETFNWYTGLVPTNGQWSFVALVVTPTDATIHLMSTNGILSAVHHYPHAVQGFGPGSTTLIGDDSGGSGGNRVFGGAVDDVAVFNYALSKSQLLDLFTTASGLSQFPPIIASSPTNLSLYAGQTAQLAVTAGGSDVLTYQWQMDTGSGYVNLTDGGRVLGSTTPVLTIQNLQGSDAANYVVAITNAYGFATSSPPANLSVSPTSPAENITMSGVLQPGGNDWDSAGNWSDGQGASISAAQKPGSTYEILPSGGLNTRLRTPLAPTVAVFPGDVLTVTGNAVWTNNPGTNGATSEVRFKQPTPAVGSGAVYFKKLVMNGGQLDAGADSGNNTNTIIVGGEIDILTNTPFYNDNGADRGYRIDAWLTGGSTSSIEYHGYNQSAFQSNYIHNLNIAGTSNTFSGKWNIVLGTLLATGTNALGTNDIVIGPNAAFETTYNVNNPNGNLFLSGRMYLHQNDTFKSLFVNGAPLAVGTYTFAQLNAAYPSNFPNAWMPQIGAASFIAGSGSITVLVQPAPTIVLQPASVSKFPTETAQFTVTAQGNQPLFYQWRKNGANLADSTDGRILGSSTTNLTITNLVAGDGANYTVVVTNSIGAVTSLVATLTILPTGPALDLTLDYGGAPIIQNSGLDWNSITNWSDGNAASLSALTNPGSIYHVVTGARLRSPASVAYAAFPGVELRVEGSGVFVNNNDATIGEIRFKHANPGTNYFKKLVMNGGQLDSGDNGLFVIQGEMDINANTPIYVDSAAGQDRPYQIDAYLTGAGTVEYRAFNNSFGGNLNLTCPTNTFHGRWYAVQGLILGSGTGSLGTNSITVGAAGAVETDYDLNSPNANLILDATGEVFLHQNDTFGNVAIGGVWLAPGVYTFAQLNAVYAANFPVAWPNQAFSAGGSLTVLKGPVALTFVPAGANLRLSWPQGTLLEADQITGPWTTNTATSPLLIVPGATPEKFYRVQVP